jgi:hypothetical protein
MTQYYYHPTVPSHQQQAYPVATHPRWPSSPDTNRYLELGKFGAVVGLCGAGAANLRRMQRDEITGSEALFDSLRTGVAAGLATATAGLVASQFRSSLLSLAATLATGTAVMYALNTESREKAPGGNR